MAMKSEGSRPVVYMRGLQEPRATPTWYSIDVDSITTSLIEEQRLPLSFQLKSHRGGSWTIVGEHILYIGGMCDKFVKFNPDRDRHRRERRRLERRRLHWREEEEEEEEEEEVKGFTKTEITGVLLSYNTASDCTNPSWKSVSPARQFPLHSPYIFAQISSKLYVLGGGERFAGGCHCPHWGEIYDLDSKTWNPLKIDVKKHGPFIPCKSAILEYPTRFVLYSTVTGRILFYDVNKDEIFVQHHPDFVLYECSVPPKGLDTWDAIDIVVHSTYKDLPMVDGSTFYWFANDMRLYGYDLLEKSWFRSQSLETELWEPQDIYDFYVSPILINLRDGRFLLIAHKSSGTLGMASLAVDKEKGSFTLSVRVESLHTLLVDPSFLPHDAALIMQRGEKVESSKEKNVSMPSSSNTISQDKASHKQSRSSHDEQEEITNISRNLGEVAAALTKIANSRLDVTTLYKKIMAIEGFDEEFLATAFDHLVQNEMLGRAFMAKSHNLRMSWLKKFKRQQ